MRIVTQGKRVPELLLIQGEALLLKGYGVEPRACTLGLSLASIVDLSKFGERDASMASLLKFADLSDCCCRFKSSTDCSPTGMKVLCVRIAATCGAVINVEAAYSCRASIGGLIGPE